MCKSVNILAFLSHQCCAVRALRRNIRNILIIAFILMWMVDHFKTLSISNFNIMSRSMKHNITSDGRISQYDCYHHQVHIKEVVRLYFSNIVIGELPINCKLF